MADFLSFAEGRREIARNGLPQVCWFLLSTKSVGQLADGDTLLGGVGEITGTGYKRLQEDRPITAPQVKFAPKTWSTGTNSDWPDRVRSVILATSEDNAGVAICAWNLLEAGRSRDLSAPHTSETFTPVLEIN